MTSRIYNFSAGPAVLPERVLSEVQRDLLALPGAGASILEISHRSSEFAEIIQQAEANLRRLLDIPDSHAVLFLQGGSRMQFSMVPMNLFGAETRSADYIQTGSWGKHAANEARKEGEVRLAWDGSSTNFDRLPAADELDLDPNAAYVHFTSNETIEGVEFTTQPAVGNVPLVCDASSDFLSRPVAVEQYGLIYACAQKNAGPAGVTLVIIRKDLLARSRADLPGYLSYKVHADSGSLWNTPATFAVYVLGLVAQWILDDVGGLERMHEQNQAKAKLLYDVLDASEGFYSGHAQRDCRSIMNVTFRLPSDELTNTFAQNARQQGLHSLRGHRSVGGIRASIYNAMPMAGVQALRDFMIDFRENYG